MTRKILLATHHLANFAGSELVLFDLAKEFKKMQYDVTIAAFIYDYPLKQLFEENDLTVKNLFFEELGMDEVDLIWAQHSPILTFILFEKKVKARHVIISSLSPIEPLEAPPIYTNELSLCLSMSEANKEIIVASGIDNKKVQVFPNSVPDKTYSFYREDRECRLQKIAVISNHVPPELEQAIALLRAGNIEVEIVGMHHNYGYVSLDKLADYDAVVTIGRTVQHALAMGVAVYCYDHFGGPGWITEQNIDLSEKHNFSGRCTQRKICASRLTEEILEGFPDAFRNRGKLNEVAKQRYSLTKNITAVLGKLTTVDQEKLSAYSLVNRHNCYYLQELKYRLHLEKTVQTMEERINGILTSRSYRITAPLRFVKNKIYHFFD